MVVQQSESAYQGFCNFESDASEIERAPCNFANLFNASSLTQLRPIEEESRKLFARVQKGKKLFKGSVASSYI